MAQRRPEVSIQRGMLQFLEAEDPLEALRELGDLRALLAVSESGLVTVARSGGATWEEIGAAMGTSRQAAWERHRALAPKLRSRAKKLGQRARKLETRVKRAVDPARDVDPANA